MLIHVEVQGRYEEDFELRLYVYHYRIFDRYGHHVSTFAILTDEDPQWQPSEFRYELLGTVASLHFVTSKLIAYFSEWARLEASSNPFAVVVMAHLKTLESRRDPEVRYHWKWLLTRMLYERGYDRRRIISLFRFIDWMMGLSADLQERFRNELYEFEERQRMPYITSIERIGLEKGRIEGLIEGRVEGHVKGRVEGRVEGKYQHALETVQRFAKHKFGELGDSIHMALTTLKLEDLDALIEALFKMESKQELIDWLKQAKKE